MKTTDLLGMTSVAVTTAAASLLSFNAYAASDGCGAAPPPVAACHTVHGRLDIYNGRWGSVIWVVGTKHLLGVLDDKDGNQLLPDNVVLNPGDDYVYGDFTVCPLVPPRLGRVEQVCVRSVRRMVVKRHG